MIKIFNFPKTIFLLLSILTIIYYNYYLSLHDHFLSNSFFENASYLLFPIAFLYGILGFIIKSNFRIAFFIVAIYSLILRGGLFAFFLFALAHGGSN